MDIQQLESLAEVCKYNSFTRAANALFLSQSSISKNIASLEHELGIVLLERTNHQVTPTKAGAYLAREAARLSCEMSAVASRAKQIASGKLGFLRLGVSDELDLNGLIPGFISGFSRRYPEIEISISIHSYCDLTNLILTGDLDAAIGPCQSIGVPNLMELDLYAVNRATPRLYYSCDHRYAGRNDLQLSDFTEDAFVSLNNRYTGTLRQLKELGIEFKNVVYVDSLQAMKLYIEANLGVALLGESHAIINSPRVCTLRVPAIPKVGTDLITRKNPVNETTTLFADELRKYLENRKKEPKLP